MRNTSEILLLINIIIVPKFLIYFTKLKCITITIKFTNIIKSKKYFLKILTAEMYLLSLLYFQATLTSSLLLFFLFFKIVYDISY